jgi:hypothetical protein
VVSLLNSFLPLRKLKPSISIVTQTTAIAPTLVSFEIFTWYNFNDNFDN